MISAIGRLAVLAFAMLLSLSGCGAQQQGPPRFEQAFGLIDSPCAIASAASDVVQHCTAHVWVVNKGGEGVGHITLVVQLTDPKASSAGASSLKCGKSIPDMPSNGYVDLACNFDLPAGKAIGAVPFIYSLDYAAAVTPSSSSLDIGGLSTLIMAGATTLLAVATLIAVLGRRLAAPGEAPAVQPVARVPAASRPSSPAQPAQRVSDPEYDIPPLPR